MVPLITQIIELAIDNYESCENLIQLHSLIQRQIPEAHSEMILIAIRSIDMIVDKCFDADMNYNGKLG